MKYEYNISSVMLKKMTWKPEQHAIWNLQCLFAWQQQEQQGCSPSFGILSIEVYICVN